ncbi:MAG: hypothetical protein WCK35_07415 [Chloroflexota bacterium]
MSTYNFFKYLVFLAIVITLPLTSCLPAQETGTNTLSSSGEEKITNSNIPLDTEPESVNGKVPESLVMESAPISSIDTATWQIYKNDIYSFSLKYPDYYEINNTSIDNQEPQAVVTIQFIDKNMKLKDIISPGFSIQVFSNPKNLALKSWLYENNYQDGTDWQLVNFENRQNIGIKVLSKNFMSPGEFIFLTHKEWVVELIPMGDEGNEIVNTINFDK